MNTKQAARENAQRYREQCRAERQPLPARRPVPAEHKTALEAIVARARTKEKT